MDNHDSSLDAQISVASSVSPFDFLLNQTIQTAIYMPELDAPRKRGRPRKYFDVVAGKQKHNMDDKRPTVGKFLTAQQQRDIERQFKNLYLQQQRPLRQTLELLSSTYEISYVQAHEALQHLI